MNEAKQGEKEECQGKCSHLQCHPLLFLLPLLLLLLLKIEQQPRSPALPTHPRTSAPSVKGRYAAAAVGEDEKVQWRTDKGEWS